MTLKLCTRVLALSILAPAATLLPSTLSQRAGALDPTSVAALHASFDPTLETLRAGRADAGAPLTASARVELASASRRDVALADARGAGPTNNEWTWLAIGAGIVVLIVLL